MKKLINKWLYTILNFKKNKIMIGTKIKLKPSGSKPSSANTNINSAPNEIFTVVRAYSDQTNAWYIVNSRGENAGWVYDWEIQPLLSTREELESEIAGLKSKIDEVQSKLQFLNETGYETFNEDEYKVYSTLSLLEDDKLSKIEKSKIIAELIRK